MEGRGEHVALTQADHIAVHLGLDRRRRTDFGHERPTDEHQRNILEYDIGRDALGNMLARCDHDGIFAGNGAKVGSGGKGTELTPISVTAHDGVKRTEVDVRIIIQPSRQQNHASAGAEHRLARGDMRRNRIKQTGRPQKLALRGAFTTRQDYTVNGVIEILDGTQQLPRGAKTVQHGGMLGECTLHCENAGHAVTGGFGTCGHIGRLFLCDILNGYNHRISLCDGKREPRILRFPARRVCSA